MNDAVVTPWEVKGKLDYAKLIKEFGTKEVDDALLERIKKDFGELHPFLSRKIFFSHRDLDWLLDKYEKGEKFYIYTGRGPSAEVHLGHLIPWIFAKYLQDHTGAEFYFQYTDDEKFLVKGTENLDFYTNMAYENLLDVLALGIDINKLHVFVDTKDIGRMYKLALNVSKHVTYSTVKAVFGINDSDNIGKIFYTSLQSVLAFLPSVEKGNNIPCLIPCGIDQDPHFRLTRDVAPKLGFYKPAIIHNKLMPGLTGDSKMSSSDLDSVIYTTDNDKTINKKIMNAFTGGKSTVSEQRKEGANPYICPIFYMYSYLFEPLDDKLNEREQNCKNGNLLCGECKAELSSRVIKYLKNHRENREKAKKYVEKIKNNA